LIHQTIQYYENKMRKENWKHHINDHMNVHMWILEHPKNVFFLTKRRQNKGHTLQNQYINTIVNCLVVGIWA